MNFLKEKGVMTKVYFEPIHTTKFYSKISTKKSNLSNSLKISEQILSLPMFPSLTINELQYIVDSVNEFFQQ